MKSLPRILLLAALACPAGRLPADLNPINLPNIGDSAGQLITPEEERQVGAAFMRHLRQSEILVQDPEIESYIQSLGYRLLANSDLLPHEFTFFVVDDPAINAFAVPGGYIGIHTGLLLAAETESELAGVVAHEIAHIMQRHMARSVEAAERLSIPATAALLAALLIGTQNSEAGMAAAMAAQAGSLQYQINFTRANEKEADRVGIGILSEAGFDPMGMPKFFERLQKSSRLYGEAPPEFLSTHPVTTNRIAESMTRAEQIGRSGQTDSEAFQLAKAKLRVLETSEPARYLSEYRRNSRELTLKTPTDRYEMALLMKAAGQPENARPILEDLHKTDPDRIAYRIALSDLYLDSGKTKAALGMYSDTLHLYPGNQVITLQYAKALLKAGKTSDARKVLNGLIDNNTRVPPEAYRLLARAASADKQSMETHTAMAEYYYLNGLTHDAIEQFSLALKSPGISFYEKSKIEARQKVMQDELLETEDR